LRRRAAQVGLGRAEVGVALADGGAGLGGFLRGYSPRAECVPDFYHAAGHLNGLAKALHPDGARAREAAGAWCHAREHEGGAAPPAALAALDLRGRQAEAREAHRREVGYVRDNLHRLDHPR
jgi:hypothetical protein